MDTSSWLGKAVSHYSRSPDASRSRSKPPRWRTPSPMSASMIPPPIVASIYSKSSPAASPSQAPVSPVNDELSFFHRKQKQLESDLQILLDAQADGLLSGLDGNVADEDATSTGSSTPTALSSNIRSTRTGISSMQRQPKIGLREARKGIYTTMRKLVLLKVQESDYLMPEVEECDAIVTQLEGWERKKLRLEERTHQIHQGEEHKKAEELRKQAHAMQNDINHLEARLAQMKTQQRKLRREAQDCEKEVDAKLSSYTASLGILDQKAKDFLIDLQRERSRSSTTADSRLASQAPTVGQARKSYNLERKQLKGRQDNIEKDREALEEGAVVWKDVVKEVSEFERRLREDMAHLISTAPNPRSRVEQGDTSEAKNGSEQSTRDIQALLAHLDQTTTQLESKYKLAQTRDWKLLVAAIGAELEAFLKGKEILEAALGAVTLSAEDLSTSLDHDPTNQSVYDDFRTPRGSVIRHVEDGEAIRHLDQAFESKKQDSSTSASSDTEDDGPDSDLLISQHDTDTDTD